MLVISNNIINDLKGIKEDYIVRLNMAWVETYNKLMHTLYYLQAHDVFLDYPDGRTKPPKPTLKLCHAVKAIEAYPNIKYLGISNAEFVQKMIKIRELVNPRVKLVPKIESKAGVNNMMKVMKALDTDTAMLDKEDIYTSVGADQKEYTRLVNKARKTANKHNCILIELEGVVFRRHK